MILKTENNEVAFRVDKINELLFTLPRTIVDNKNVGQKEYIKAGYI